MTTQTTAPTTDPADLDEAALMEFVFRAVDEVGATLNSRPRRDGRPARLLPGPRRARPADRRRAGRDAPTPASSTPGSGSTPRPPAPS